MATLIIGFARSAFYHVYLVARFGGTPGKLALDIRIRMVDGSPVTLRAAVRRTAVTLALGAVSTVAYAYVFYRSPDGTSVRAWL